MMDASKVLTCLSCETENLEGSKYCRECGNNLRLIGLKRCLHCNQKLKSNEKFCPECGTNVGAGALHQSVSIPDSPSIGSMLARKKDLYLADSYKEMNVFASQWSGATRALLGEDEEDRYINFVANTFERLRSMNVESRLVVEFENHLAHMISKLQSSKRFPKVVEDVGTLLPERLHRILREPSLDSNFLENGPLFSYFLNHQWPYAAYARTWDVPEIKLNEICLQTLREGFYISNIGISTRRRYLEEELIRLESGMYPTLIASDLEGLLSQMWDALKRDKEEYQEGKTDMEVTTISRYLIAPFAVSEYVDEVNEDDAFEKKIQYHPLSNTEMVHLRRLISGEHRLSEMINFLEDRYVDINQQIEDLSKLAEIREDVLRNLEFAHTFVTAMHNMFCRIRFIRDINKGSRLIRIQEGLLPKRGEVVRANFISTIGKSDPEFLDALFAKTESLFSLQFEILREHGGRMRRRVFN